MVRVKGKENTTLDVCKALACVIVTTAHLPSLFTSEVGHVYFNEWYLRFCVPFSLSARGTFSRKLPTKESPSSAWLG